MFPSLPSLCSYLLLSHLSTWLLVALIPSPLCQLELEHNLSWWPRFYTQMCACMCVCMHGSDTWHKRCLRLKKVPSHNVFPLDKKMLRKRKATFKSGTLEKPNTLLHTDKLHKHCAPWYYCLKISRFKQWHGFCFWFVSQTIWELCPVLFSSGDTAPGLWSQWVFDSTFVTLNALKDS